MDEDQLEELAAALAEKLKLRVGRLVQGAAEDIEQYAAEIAADMATAALLQDEQALAHLKGQTRLLAEKHRLAASEAAWATVGELAFDLADILRVAVAVML